MMMEIFSTESLPLGFRFRPTDEELINHYLRLKINGRHSDVHVIPEVDICKREPWDLPGLSVIKTDDPEWFFFCPRDRKYPNGHRSNRATDAGYWKATGKDRSIKSRRPSGSNSHLIGMKKTLVFYRGRAPKGKRTNWIIHEYRATSEDLDGTGPGQGAFVLCRLFRKPDEKIDVLKYDEMEPTGFSPTTTKSSLDDMSSDIVQETALSDMQVRKQPEGIKSWLTDDSDNMTSNAPIPFEGYCNNSLASDVEDCLPEETAAEPSPLTAEDLKFESTCGQIDCKAFSPLQLQIQTEIGPHLDSPFASDFGNGHNGFLFQDGTSEQDFSFTEVLDEVLNNHDECSGEESTNHNLGVGSTQMFGHVCPLPSGLVENSSVKDSGSYSDRDTEMAQEQMGASGWFNEHVDSTNSMQTPMFSKSYQSQAPLADLEIKRGNMGASCDDFVGLDALSADSGSFYGFFSNLEESAGPKNFVDSSSGHVGGTGIKIRMRQPQRQPNSDNFVTQGIAPRRIRLQMTLSQLLPGSVCTGKLGDTSCPEEVHEAQTTVTEAGGAEQIDTTDKAEKERCQLEFDREGKIAQECTMKLRLRMKQDGESDSCRLGSSVPLKALPAHRGSIVSSVYIVGVSLVVILFTVFIGIWRWLSF